MILPLQKFSSLLETMAAGVQGGATQLVDLSVGSVLRSLMEACAAVALWLQWLIVQVLATTRAATSTGTDLDSWMADFSLVRLPGASGVGQVVFARFTSGLAALVPLGTIVMTADRTQSFIVTEDEANPAWNGTSGYALPASASNVVVPVQAVSQGTLGNVMPGAVGLLASALPGVDYVENLEAFVGGADPESDTALRARFQLYINSRSLATVVAIEFAVQSVQQGLRFAVLENVNTANQPQIGNFWVVVDDGTGTPSASLLQYASAAVESVRPLGASYAVTGPGIVPITVLMSVMTSSSASHASVCTSIANAIQSWISGLPIGGTLALSKLEAIAHNTDPTVQSVTSNLVNGGIADIAAPTASVLITSSVTVT